MDSQAPKSKIPLKTPKIESTLELKSKKPQKNKKVQKPAEPIVVVPKSPKKKGAFFTKLKNLALNLTTVPLSEKLFFADNLRVMVRAGLSMAEALETLSMQTKNKKFSKVLHQIRKGVMEGNTLASMLSLFPKIFPNYFVNMIRVGEKSGNLEENLEQLALQMKKDHEITTKVRGAMIYPAVILIATIGIVILMFVYVIPSVLSIFDEMEIGLPLATRILIALSKVITNYGIFLLIAMILFVGSLIILSKTKKGKRIVHSIFLNLWIIGPIVRKVNLARFSRTISSLLKTDIPVIESFKITASVLGNVYYKNACHNVSKELAKGAAINEVLKQDAKLFPPLVTQMVLVGEKSGTLDTLLGELATFYENQVSEITKNLSSIIEPILIVMLGAAVALIAFAIISPIYSLSQSL